jgi:hypothetical protein
VSSALRVPNGDIAARLLAHYRVYELTPLEEIPCRYILRQREVHMRRLLPGRPSTFLLRATILALPLLAGSVATFADAQTSCYILICTLQSNGDEICLKRPIICPPTNT